MEQIRGSAGAAAAAACDGRVERPFVTVVIPCRNERTHIERCVRSLLANDYPRDRLEILVIDGMSEDGTRKVVSSLASETPLITLLDNPQRTTPAALNLGVQRARGAVFMRADAHNDYPPHYIRGLVEWLERSGADNVGGTVRTCASGSSPMALAIAFALAHPLGVGNSHFRIGVKEPRWVDTVPFGCYRADVFQRIGGFDEDLTRNQDDEFNLRLLRHGGRILLVPDIQSDYYARESLRKLARMWYQYGYFKPLVIRKIGAVLTVRQLAPAAFILLNAIFMAATPWSKLARVALAVMDGCYFLAIVGVAIGAVARLHVASTRLFAVFPVLHLSYGVGFVRGMVDVFRRRTPVGAHVTLSR